MVAVMDRVAHCYQQGGVAMLEIGENRLRNIIEGVKRLELCFECTINIVDRLLGVDPEQISMTVMGLAVNPHGIGEVADRAFDDFVLIQRFILKGGGRRIELSSALTSKCTTKDSEFSQEMS